MFVVLVGVVKRDSSALRLTRAETQLGAFSRPLSKDPQHKITTIRSRDLVHGESRSRSTVVWISLKLGLF